VGIRVGDRLLPIRICISSGCCANREETSHQQRS